MLRDIRPSRLAGQLAGIDWRWVGLAMICFVLSYVVQAVRWQLLLEPVGKIRLLEAAQAIFVGLFTNEVLPMRPGEFARAYLASRLMSAPFVAILPSIIVERLFDGVWLALSIGLAAIFAPLPEDLIQAGETFGAAIALLVALFIYLAVRPPGPGRAHRAMLKWKPLRSVAAAGAQLRDGLRETGRTKEFYLAFALSLLFLALQTLAFWLIMLGYGLPVSLWIGVAVFVIVNLGTAIPNTPGNIGSYQFFTVLGLTMFGVEKTPATEFSLVV
ncbi:MAG TPA: lysylphosphatidylglycerol synthase transmembrane domain-containing protein, partial [Blastocatellia bacterium]